MVSLVVPHTINSSHPLSIVCRTKARLAGISKDTIATPTTRNVRTLIIPTPKGAEITKGAAESEMGPRVSRPALENCLQDLPGVKIDSKQVEETEEILGSGAYGEVIVALYNGVRYASKKLHEALVENDERISPNDPNSPVRKFREECQRMSQLRHPNIVQFIGVYF